MMMYHPEIRDQIYILVFFQINAVKLVFFVHPVNGVYKLLFHIFYFVPITVRA